MYAILNYGKIKVFMVVSWVLGFVWGFMMLGVWFESLRFGIDERTLINAIYLFTAFMLFWAIVIEEYSRYMVNKTKICHLTFGYQIDLDPKYVDEFNVLNVGSVAFRIAFILSLLLGYHEDWSMLNYYGVVLVDFAVALGFTWNGYKAFKRMLTEQMFKDIKIVEL